MSNFELEDDYSGSDEDETFAGQQAPSFQRPDPQDENFRNTLNNFETIGQNYAGSGVSPEIKKAQNSKQQQIQSIDQEVEQVYKNNTQTKDPFNFFAQR